MTKKPLIPRNSELTRAIHEAKKDGIAVTGKRFPPGKELRCFNGSENSRRRKKRPITLPERA